MNGCWEYNNRMGQRGKELGDMEMERSDEGDGGQKMDKGRMTEDRVTEVVGNGIRKT